MRIILTILAACALLAMATPAHATPIGGLSYNIGVAGPSFSIASGVGFVQRDVHIILDDSRVGEATSSRWFVKVDAGPIKYLDVYGLIGAADFKISGTELGEQSYRGNLATFYGGGIRPQLLPLGLFTSKVSLAADLQYAAFTTEDEIGGETFQARYQEGQVALVLTYNLKMVIPYGGLKYNPINVDITGVKNDLKGDIDAGVFIGTDYFVTPSVFFSGELSIFSETSIFLTVGYNYPPQR